MKKISLIGMILASIILFSACGNKKQKTETPKPLKVEVTAETEDLTVEQLQEMNGDSLEVALSPKTERIRELRGKFSNVTIQKPEDALLALMSVRTIFGISGQEFTCIQVDEEEDHRTYWLQQLYKGVPVDQGVFRIVASSKGMPEYVRGVYQDGLNLEVKPDLDVEEALKKYGVEESVKETSLVIYSSSNVEPTLSWRYLANVGTAKEKYLYLDANTGELLENRSMIIE